MKTEIKQCHLLTVLVTGLLLSNCKSPVDSVSADRDRPFNTGWKFIRDSLIGAEQPGYDDSEW